MSLCYGYSRSSHGVWFDPFGGMRVNVLHLAGRCRRGPFWKQNFQVNSLAVFINVCCHLFAMVLLTFVENETTKNNFVMYTFEFLEYTLWQRILWWQFLFCFRGTKLWKWRRYSAYAWFLCMNCFSNLLLMSLECSRFIVVHYRAL